MLQSGATVRGCHVLGDCAAQVCVLCAVHDYSCGCVLTLTYHCNRYLPLVDECCVEDEDECRCHGNDHSHRLYLMQSLIVICSALTHMGFVMVQSI